MKACIAAAVLVLAGAEAFAQQIGHLTEEHYLFCSGVKGEKNPQEGGNLVTYLRLKGIVPPSSAPSR